MPPNYYSEPVQQNPQESEWYVPQGAIPQGFELEENLGKVDTVQQQPVNVPQPPVWMNGVDENQPILYDWADYSKKLPIIITHVRLQRAAGESHATCRVSILYICRVLGHIS